MKKYLVYAGIIGIAAFCSCNSKDAEPHYPIEYKSESLGEIKSIRIFTKDGEVSNMKIVKAYQDRYESFSTYLGPIFGYGYLKIISSDSAKFANLDFRLSIRREGDKILFSSSRLLLGTPNPKQFFLKYTKAAQWEGYGYLGYLVFPAKEVNNTLEFSVLNWVLTETDTVRNRWRQEINNGVLDELKLSESKLVNSDTLAVLEYSFILKKE